MGSFSSSFSSPLQAYSLAVETRDIKITFFSILLYCKSSPGSSFWGTPKFLGCCPLPTFFSSPLLECIGWWWKLEVSKQLFPVLLPCKSSAKASFLLF